MYQTQTAYGHTSRKKFGNWTRQQPSQISRRKELETIRAMRRRLAESQPLLALLMRPSGRLWTPHLQHFPKSFGVRNWGLTLRFGSGVKFDPAHNFCEMSARHIQATKRVHSEEYKRVGVIILTTLAVNGTTGQSIDVPIPNSTEGSKYTDGAKRRAQRHGLNTESNTASAPRPEGTSSPPGLTEDVMLEGGLLTEQGNGINQKLALEDGESSPLEKSGEYVESEQFIPAHLETTSESGPPVVASVLQSDIEDALQILETRNIRNDFHNAALRPLPVSMGRSDDSRAEESVKLDIPRFLHPANRIANPRLEVVEEIVNLHQANKSEQAFAVMRAHFSEGEFEKHLFAFLRQRMFDRRTILPGPHALPCELLECYTNRLQQWCASVFDATVRRVKFAIDPVKSCLSEEDPITGEMKCHSNVEIPSDLTKDIAKARAWKEKYLQAEPKFRTAVNKFKNELADDFHKEWIAYKENHALTSSTTKTRKLEQPLRSKTFLSKNTHFISWFMRRMTPACFLFRRRQIAKAITAIEGNDSMLANVLENLCVQDVEAFKKFRRTLEEERFHSYVKVPLP